MKAGSLVVTAFVVFGCVFAQNPGWASQANPQPSAQRPQAQKPAQARAATASKPANRQQPNQAARRPTAQAQRVAASNPVGISCVPYVRQATGMAIRGNGGDWWHNAAGLYARGHRPEPGAVMAFSRSGRMRMGHVAVVQQVVSAREILIHHANWAGPGIRRGSIMRDVSVIDVSLRNDWSAVRVQVGRDQESLGRVYAIQGFIYDRPDNGYQRTASTPRPGGPLMANAHSLRPSDLRSFEELAQAPAGVR